MPTVHGTDGVSKFPYFPDEVSVTGTPQELRALRAVPGFQGEDHGHVYRDDGRLTIVGYTAQTNTATVVAQIRALGLEVSVRTADEQKAQMATPPGPDPDDGGGTS